MTTQEALPSMTKCAVCQEKESVTALLIGKATLVACLGCAKRLVDGEFFYRQRPELTARGSLATVGDRPLAFPLRAVH